MLLAPTLLQLLSFTWCLELVSVMSHFTMDDSLHLRWHWLFLQLLVAGDRHPTNWQKWKLSCVVSILLIFHYLKQWNINLNLGEKEKAKKNEVDNFFGGKKTSTFLIIFVPLSFSKEDTDWWEQKLGLTIFTKLTTSQLLLYHIIHLFK